MDRKLTYKQARGLSCMNQEEIAKKMHISKPTYLRVESYLRIPTIQELEDFCKACGVEISDIQWKKK